MNYAQTFLMTNSSLFPSESIPLIQKEVRDLDDSSVAPLLMTEWKNPTVALLLALFLGEFGVDRFYTKDIGLGVAKLVLTIVGILTSWLLIGFVFLFAVYIWKIIDCFLIMSSCRQGNVERLLVNINQMKHHRSGEQTPSAEQQKSLFSLSTQTVTVTSEGLLSSVEQEDIENIEQDAIQVETTAATKPKPILERTETCDSPNILEGTSSEMLAEEAAIEEGHTRVE